MDTGELGIRIVLDDGSLVFCKRCQAPIKQGLRIIRYNTELRVFDEIGVFHEECVEDPVQLLQRAEFHIIPAIYLRSAL